MFGRVVDNNIGQNENSSQHNRGVVMAILIMIDYKRLTYGVLPAHPGSRVHNENRGIDAY